MIAGHNQRVVIYAIRLAEQVNLPREQIHSLIQGAFLHDIEMLPVDNDILMKSGNLDNSELDIVKKHAKEGAVLLKKFRWLRGAEAIVRCHHEKYDGSGYPAGLAHEKVPMAARIFAIADAFDALSTKRPYRKPVSIEEALRKIEQESGTHFDPVLVSNFIGMAPQLYSRLTSLDDKNLDKELDTILKKYLNV